MISSKIEFKLKDSDIIKEILSSEKRERSETKIEQKGDSIIIKIEAGDLTAYKATLNQYLKLIETAMNAMKVK